MACAKRREKNLGKHMKPWQINILIISGVVLSVRFVPDEIYDVFMVIVVSFSAYWVYTDAKKIEVGKYRNTIFGRGPSSYTASIVFLWLFALPFYIYHRQQVIDGKIPLKEIKEKEKCSSS